MDKIWWWTRFGKAQHHWRETHVVITVFRGTILLKISTGDQLIYVVLVSAIQHSESETQIHSCFSLRFFSHAGHYRILSTVPCVIQ